MSGLLNYIVACGTIEEKVLMCVVWESNFSKLGQMFR